MRGSTGNGKFAFRTVTPMVLSSGLASRPIAMGAMLSSRKKVEDGAV